MAGNDMLLFSDYLPEVIQAIFEKVPHLVGRLQQLLPPEVLSAKIEKVREFKKRLPPSLNFQGSEEKLIEHLYWAALTERGPALKAKRFIEIIAPPSDAVVRKINARFARGESLALILYGSPYILSAFPCIPALVAYEDNQWTREAVDAARKGEFAPSGRLPISLDDGL